MDNDAKVYDEPGRIIRLSDDHLEALSDGDVIACFNAFATRKETGLEYVYLVNEDQPRDVFRTVVERERAAYVNELLSEYVNDD